MATIIGDVGNNYLPGTSVGDYIYGLGGNDTLVGGLGADNLYGGLGADVFKYNSTNETWGDTIRDYKWQQGDKIDLSAIDAKTYEFFKPSTWGNQAFHWEGNLVGKGLDKGDLGYVHSGGNTYVYGNVDGDGAYEVALTLTGTINLISSDFVL